MKLITRAELITLIKSIKGATFATITLSTDPTMRKTNNPFHGMVKKVAIHNVCLNFNYENSVNRQREREDKIADFEAQSTWGVHESPAIVVYKDQTYLQAKLEKTLNFMYVSTIDRKPVDASQLEEFLPKRSEMANQGVNETIKTIKPKIDNIVAISVKGEDYQIVG